MGRRPRCHVETIDEPPTVPPAQPPAVPSGQRCRLRYVADFPIRAGTTGAQFRVSFYLTPNGEVQLVPAGDVAPQYQASDATDALAVLQALLTRALAETRGHCR
jgi:hypothetical protein